MKKAPGERLEAAAQNNPESGMGNAYRFLQFLLRVFSERNVMLKLDGRTERYDHRKNRYSLQDFFYISISDGLLLDAAGGKNSLLIKNSSQEKLSIV